MDADLQHPPENVKDLLEALPDRPEGASIQPPQFALGTRYGSGNSIDRDWPMYRRVISWGARLLSRPLTSAEDPMGGFFALRRDLVGLVLAERDTLNATPAEIPPSHPVHASPAIEPIGIQDWPRAPSEDALETSRARPRSLLFRKEIHWSIEARCQSHGALRGPAPRTLPVEVWRALLRLHLLPGGECGMGRTDPRRLSSHHWRVQPHWDRQGGARGQAQAPEDEERCVNIARRAC